MAVCIESVQAITVAGWIGLCVAAFVPVITRVKARGHLNAFATNVAFHAIGENSVATAHFDV